MTAVTAADPEVPAFAVGTQSPRTDNQVIRFLSAPLDSRELSKTCLPVAIHRACQPQVHIFHYHEEEESLSATVYSHAPEIWNIAATSSRPGVIATCAYQMLHVAVGLLPY